MYVGGGGICLYGLFAQNLCDLSLLFLAISCLEITKGHLYHVI